MSRFFPLLGAFVIVLAGLIGDAAAAIDCFHDTTANHSVYISPICVAKRAANAARSTNLGAPEPGARELHAWTEYYDLTWVNQNVGDIGLTDTAGDLFLLKRPDTGWAVNTAYGFYILGAIEEATLYNNIPGTFVVTQFTEGDWDDDIGDAYATWVPDPQNPTQIRLEATVDSYWPLYMLGDFYGVPDDVSVAAPEPSTLVLLGFALGGLGLIPLRRRSRSLT